MKKNKNKLETFSNSELNSEEENKFMENTITNYFDEKLRKKYSSTLKEQYNIEKGEVRNEPSLDSKGKSKSIIYIIAGSVLLLTLIAAYFLTSQESATTDSNAIYASNIDPYYTEIDFTTRGLVSDTEVLAQIAKSYDAKDFTRIAVDYQKLETLELIEGRYLHAIAVSLAKVDKNDEALEIWDVLLSTQESKFTYHNTARFFQGRLLLELGETQKGNEILQAVGNGSEFYDEAQKLLK